MQIIVIIFDVERMIEELIDVETQRPSESNAKLAAIDPCRCRASSADTSTTTSVSFVGRRTSMVTMELEANHFVRADLPVVEDESDGAFVACSNTVSAVRTVERVSNDFLDFRDAISAEPIVDSASEL